MLEVDALLWPYQVMSGSHVLYRGRFLLVTEVGCVCIHSVSRYSTSLKGFACPLRTFEEIDQNLYLFFKPYQIDTRPLLKLILFDSLTQLDCEPVS